MATKLEVERLAVLETKMTTVQEQVKTLDSKVERLPDVLIKRLDDKYSQRELTEKRLEDIEDVISPLKSIKKRLWTWFISLVFGIAVIEAVAAYIFTEVVKK